jgi:Raf kinase inhibitor-like YbhB/YbcL family protein
MIKYIITTLILLPLQDNIPKILELKENLKDNQIKLCQTTSYKIIQPTTHMKLISSFKDGDKLPSKYTCDGDGISPEIHWEEAPPETKSFVLIYDDPDASAGIWDHWVLYNLPPTTTSIPEDARSLPEGTQLGLNSWGKPGYGRACPSSGEHHYIFHLYALDTVLNLPSKATSKQIREAMQGYIIEEATLTAVYTRNQGL